MMIIVSKISQVVRYSKKAYQKKGTKRISKPVVDTQNFHIQYN
jgi:hypothetical protein